MYAKNVSKFWDGNKRRASAYFPLVLPKNLKCSPSQFNSMGKVKSKSYNMISPNKKKRLHFIPNRNRFTCLNKKKKTPNAVGWTKATSKRYYDQMAQLHVHQSLWFPGKGNWEWNEMKWNELVKSSQFLVWNLCYHCIRRPKVQWFYFLIFNIHLDCFSLRSSIIIKANDHSTLSESIFDYAAWKGTTILRTK